MLKTPSSLVATLPWSSVAKRWGNLMNQKLPPRAGRNCAETPELSATGKTSSTIVHFADITDAEIVAYVATKEPLEVAGAFTIDSLGGAFISRIEGDTHTVIGLSLPTLRDLSRVLGVEYTSFWNR